LVFAFCAAVFDDTVEDFVLWGFDFHIFAGDGHIGGLWNDGDFAVAFNDCVVDFGQIKVVKVAQSLHEFFARDVEFFQLFEHDAVAVDDDGGLAV